MYWDGNRDEGHLVADGQRDRRDRASSIASNGFASPTVPSTLARSCCRPPKIEVPVAAEHLAFGQMPGGVLG